VTHLPHALRILRLRLLLPLLFGRDDLRVVLRRLEAAGPGSGEPDALARLVERLTRPVRFWRTTCLWRALTGYSVLRAAGDEVRFLVGVRREAAGDLAWHAWLERGGRPSLGAPPPDGDWRVAFAWPVDAGNLVQKAEGDVPGLHASEDALLTELRDGTGVLLDLSTRFYFTLNRTGVVAWKLLAGGARDAGAIAAGVAARYPDADPAAVRRDVEALLAELRAEKLAIERA
jgi:hypothetical protein